MARIPTNAATTIIAGSVVRLLAQRRGAEPWDDEPCLRENVNDRTFIRRQVELMQRVNLSLEKLRSFWQTHPANRDWEAPEYVADDAPNYRF